MIVFTKDIVNTQSCLPSHTPYRIKAIPYLHHKKITYLPYYSFFQITHPLVRARILQTRRSLENPNVD